MADFNHIVCPHCSSINRIPAHRLRECPVCGQCKQGLFIGCAAEATERTFSRYISHSDIPVVVNFWAFWCSHSKEMIPIFKHAAMLIEPHARFVKVNIEQEQALAEKYNIRNIPTLVLFKNGVEVARRSGAMNANDLVLWMHTYM